MQHDAPNQPDDFRLSPLDAEAFDAALGALSVSVDADRAERMDAVLALLDRWPIEDPSPQLIDSLLRRLDAARCASPSRVKMPVEMPVSLSDADASVLESLLSARAADAVTGPMPADSRDRAQAVASVVGLLDHWQAQAPANDLAHRTMQRILEARDRATLTRLPMDRPSQRFAWSSGLRQVGSIAALILISMSLLIPVLSKARTDAEVASCSANLGRAGAGLQQYANDHKGTLPQDAPPVFSELMRFAEDSGDQSTPSSAVHMLVLPRDGYLREEQLTCTAADASLPAGGRYSAQAVAGSRALRLSSLDGPLMADTNPLYRRQGTQLIRQAGWVSSTSANHNNAGQNVLLSDGSVMWTLRPVIEHHNTADNIWVRDAAPPKPQRDTATTLDAFLTP